MSERWEKVSIDELDSISVAGVVWHPLRRRLGIKAFGINMYSADGVGKQTVEEHTETTSGAGGHEEIYFVVRGRATFTLDEETLDAPAGTFVFVRDPAVKRFAIAEEEDTLVLAVGGEPGKPYEVSPWETSFSAAPLLAEERWDEALALLNEGLREFPGNASILYNVACAEARAGRTADAITHLEQAIASNGKYVEVAQKDSDFDAIRAEPGFPA